MEDVAGGDDGDKVVGLGGVDEMIRGGNLDCQCSVKLFSR
jgi:hypothetical protein